MPILARLMADAFARSHLASLGLVQHFLSTLLSSRLSDQFVSRFHQPQKKLTSFLSRSTARVPSNDLTVT